MSCEKAQEEKPLARRIGRMIILIGAPLFAVAGFLYIYLYDPNTHSGFYFPCGFRWLTGLYCPGCGNTRALHALVHLDFVGMLNHNLLFFPLFFLLMWLLTGEYLKLLFGKRILWIPRRVPMAVIILLVALIILFTVLRNIPVYPFSILAPGV